MTPPPIKPKKQTGKTILIVDDEPAWRSWVRMLLELSEFQVVLLEAENGKEALAILKTAEVHGVLTDTNMSPVNGIDLLKEIRVSYPRLPVVVFFSGMSRSTLTPAQVKRMGATFVLSKDEALSRIASIVKMLLAKS